MSVQERRTDARIYSGGQREPLLEGEARVQATRRGKGRDQGFGTARMPTAHGRENGEAGVLLGRLSLGYPGTMQVMMLKRHQVSCEG